MTSGSAAGVLLGYGHASLIESLRPDIAYPTRRIRQAKSVITEIGATPCDCPDDHVEVWAQQPDTPITTQFAAVQVEITRRHNRDFYTHTLALTAPTAEMAIILAAFRNHTYRDSES